MKPSFTTLVGLGLLVYCGATFWYTLYYNQDTEVLSQISPWFIAGIGFIKAQDS